MPDDIPGLSAWLLTALVDSRVEMEIEDDAPADYQVADVTWTMHCQAGDVSGSEMCDIGFSDNLRSSRTMV